MSAEHHSYTPVENSLQDPLQLADSFHTLFASMPSEIEEFLSSHEKAFLPTLEEAGIYVLEHAELGDHFITLARRNNAFFTEVKTRIQEDVRRVPAIYDTFPAVLSHTYIIAETYGRDHDVNPTVAATSMIDALPSTLAVQGNILGMLFTAHTLEHAVDMYHFYQWQHSAANSANTTLIDAFYRDSGSN